MANIRSKWPITRSRKTTAFAFGNWSNLTQNSDDRSMTLTLTLALGGYSTKVTCDFSRVAEQLLVLKCKYRHWWKWIILWNSNQFFVKEICQWIFILWSWGRRPPISTHNVRTEYAKKYILSGFCQISEISNMAMSPEK